MSENQMEKMMTILRKGLFLLLAVVIAACGTAGPVIEEPTAVPTATATALQPATSTPTPEATATPIPPTLTPTPAYPEEGYGPADFPEGVNPLTGLEVDNPELLDRRPIIVKVQNLPRTDRPQWGLSQTDIVIEYYTEYGTTRFAAIFYGQNAEQVAPIRSARFFDTNIIRAYKGMFIFGSAYEAVYRRLVSSEFANRLMLEGSNTSEVIYRYDPNAKNYEMADLTKVDAYTERMGIDNSRPDLSGMFFQMQPPAGGQDAEQVYVRFSGAIYNRWDYDDDGGSYLRYSDTDDALGGKPEQYELLTDRANNQPITAENVAVILLRHQEVDPRPNVEVLDMSLLGTGKAYVMRDGKMYTVNWSRSDENAILTFLNEDGSPFPLKPGNTWVEVLALNSRFEEQDDGSMRFTFVSDW